MPGSKDFRKMFGPFRPTYTSDDSAFFFRNYPQVFQPGDELSLSVAFAGQFKGDRELAIVFCQPGTYELKAGGFETAHGQGRSHFQRTDSGGPVIIFVSGEQGTSFAARFGHAVLEQNGEVVQGVFPVVDRHGPLA